MTLFFSFLIGFFGGLRSLTPPAVVAWATHFGLLKITGPLLFIGSLPAVAVLTLLAAVELVMDKLPNTPSRTAIMGLSARIVLGGVVGTCVAMNSGTQIWIGAALGAVGGVAGCFAGYFARTKIVKTSGLRDIYVALCEDLVAIIGCVWVVAQLSA